MSTSARETALRVLVSCRTNGAWADAALKAQLGRDGLSGPDAALCSRIVYGVMQNRLLLDFYIGAYCSQKPDHLQPPLLDILRVGAYQILFLDKVPDSAAVNTSVELAKLCKREQAAGLVNAVLRKISQNKENLPNIPDRDEARARLGLSVNGGEVLLMCGSMGCGPMEELASALDSYLPAGVELTVVCGTNEKLADTLESSPLIRTRVLRYTDDMPAWFSAVDLLLTKPGGLTVSEALACNLPLAVFDAIPGQEEENADFLLSHDMAVHMKMGDDCAKAIQLLLRDEERLDRMRRSCEKFDKSQSIPHLMALMENLTQGEKE